MAMKFVFSFSQCIQIKEMTILCPPDTVLQVTVSKSHHVKASLPVWEFEWHVTWHYFMSKVSFLISFFCTTCTCGYFFFFCDCTQQDNFLFPVNNCRKSCNLQKKLDVIHILFCRTQQKFLWKKTPQKLCRIFTIHLEMF